MSQDSLYSQTGGNMRVYDINGRCKHISLEHFARLVEGDAPMYFLNKAEAQAAYKRRFGAANDGEDIATLKKDFSEALKVMKEQAQELAAAQKLIDKLSKTKAKIKAVD